MPNNPWKEIKLEDYENHMSLDSVYQLQTLNQIMKKQFSFYTVSSDIILGIAAGNGLEHIHPQSFGTVYGVDINADYLKACRKRYPALKDTLQLICTDLTQTHIHLPNADLLVANLLIEYIGYSCFQKTVKLVKPKYVSCVIQSNTENSFVSDSPYLASFDDLEKVHHQIDVPGVTHTLEHIGYQQTTQNEIKLPNGKKLIRIDYIDSV